MQTGMVLGKEYAELYKKILEVHAVCFLSISTSSQLRLIRGSSVPVKNRTIQTNLVD